MTFSLQPSDDVIEVRDWVMTRDHSWGLRPSVGQPARSAPKSKVSSVIQPP